MTSPSSSGAPGNASALSGSWRSRGLTTRRGMETARTAPDPICQRVLEAAVRGVRAYPLFIGAFWGLAEAADTGMAGR